MLGNSTHNVLPECSEICVLYEGPGRPTAWPEQSQVVVETVTKTSTTQKFAAVQQIHESDATKVTATGAGLQYATANKEAIFTVDTSHGGMFLYGHLCVVLLFS